MARKDTGKWVARAAATGGSRTYRGQRPTKWYLSLVLICVVGVALIWFSRYQRQNPSSTGQPTVGTHWAAAISFDLCGTTMPVLPANPDATAQLTTHGDGIIDISPTSKANAGSNANLGRFASLYQGLTIASSEVKYPGKTTAAKPLEGKTFSNGDRCPAHTHYAGQQGSVQIQVYPSFSATSSTLAGDPNTLHFANGQLITVAFLPAGNAIPKPPSSTIVKLQQTINQLITNPSSTTTTPSASVPATTAPTTTAPSGTTSPTTGPTPSK
jgi:hypothetical protein